jgi:hypothetical protein
MKTIKLPASPYIEDWYPEDVKWTPAMKVVGRCDEEIHRLEVVDGWIKAFNEEGKEMTIHWVH